MVCPECGGPARPLGRVGSSLEWYRCAGCRHIWAHRPAADEDSGKQDMQTNADLPEQCARCGRPAARVVGRSDVSRLVYVRCDVCGHVTARSEQ